MDTIKELTGDWVTRIGCFDIQKKGRPFTDEIVYFGAAEDLEKGGKLFPLVQTSMLDRFKNNEGRYSFYYNEDPECRKLGELDHEKELLVFFNGDQIAPYVIDVEVNMDMLTIDRLIFELTNRATYGTPKWGTRA